ncbi:MAG: hypothetical protein WC515_07605, partial [Candidatus Omnitrophota bacterium]
MTKILFVAMAFLAVFCHPSAADPQYDYYYFNSYDDYLLKRVFYDNGDIYEYLDEPLYGFYGRISLIYKVSEGIYRTYDWGASQVTVDEYMGAYGAGFGSDMWSDVTQSERRFSYVYDHNGEMQNLDTQTNGWILRLKDELQDDGVTLKEVFEYNGSGVMSRHSLYDAGGSLTEEYLYDGLERLIRDDHVATDRYSTYTYHDSPYQDIVSYKSEYVRSSNALLVTYGYNTSGTLISKAEADGTIYTYYASGRLESITFPSADGYGNLYYHYLDEDYAGQGYGRVDKQIRADADDDGAVAYDYVYIEGSEIILVGDLDGNGISDFIIDLGPGRGLWIGYDNAIWEQISDVSPEYIATGNIDGNGKDDLLIDFGSVYGVWALYDNGSWEPISDVSPEYITNGNIDGNGRDDMIIDFGSAYGVWVQYDDKSWERISDVSPEYITVGNLDGNGIDDLIIDFGSAYGVWVQYDDKSWERISDVSPEYITAGNLDGNGIDDLLIDFGPTYGVWIQYDDKSWERISDVSPEYITTGNFDGNGRDDLLIDFGPGYGVWVQYDDKSWEHISDIDPVSIITGDFDGNGRDELIIDFGPSYGIWIRFDNGAWLEVNGTAVKRCFENSDFTYLLVTYVYNPDGVLISKALADGTAYTYYLSGRMHTTRLPSGTIYEYDDTSVHDSGTPVTTDDYGHLIKETRPDGTYKTFSDYYDADHARFVREYSVTGELLATYEYDAAGSPIAAISYDITDGKWHRTSNFTGTLGDGKKHAQDDMVYDTYADALAGTDTGLVVHIVYTYDVDGNVLTKSIYDNAGTTKNTAYEKYTTNAAGTLLEKIFYFDGVTIAPGV